MYGRDIVCSNTYTVWVLARGFEFGERLYKVLSGGMTLKKYLGFKIVAI